MSTEKGDAYAKSRGTVCGLFETRRQMTVSYQDKDWLEQKYWRDGLSLNDIATLVNRDYRTIYRWMQRHSIPRRTRAEFSKSASFRRKVSSGVKRAWKRPGTRLGSREHGVAQSRGIKRAWADGRIGNARWRKAQSQATKTAWNAGIYDGVFGDAFKQKMCTISKRAWENGSFGSAWRKKNSEATKRCWARGIYGSEDWARKNSEATKRNWEEGKYDGRKSRPSGLEILAQEVLESEGSAFILEFSPKGMRFAFDFLIGTDMLIEINGCYWHGCPECYRNKQIGEWQIEKREIDKRKREWANANGYRLIVIWEHELKEYTMREIMRERRVCLE